MVMSSLFQVWDTAKATNSGTIWFQPFMGYFAINKGMFLLNQFWYNVYFLFLPILSELGLS